jgi:hypothetical protein
MRTFKLLIFAVVLAGCGLPINNYSDMTNEQKAIFMERHKQDLIKAYSSSHTFGKANTDIQTYPENDLISITFTMTKSAVGNSANMFDQKARDKLTRQNCENWAFKTYLDEGITLDVNIDDKHGRRLFSTTISPSLCAKL